MKLMSNADILKFVHPSFATSDKLRNSIGTPYYKKLENLIKLGRGLFLNPPPAEKFDMRQFVEFGHCEVPVKDALKELNDPKCGTVGCAVGFAPYYLSGGRFPKSCISTNGDVYISYGAYAEKYLVEDMDVFEFLFGSGWRHTDNTAQGAGKRILMFLSHGESFLKMVNRCSEGRYILKAKAYETLQTNYPISEVLAANAE